jgi:hypothetical protein
MDQIEVNVTVSGGNGGYLGPTVDLKITSPLTDVFMQAVERGVREQVGDKFGNYDGRKLAGIVWHDPEYPVGLQQIAPDNLTMGQVADYFGEEIHAWPPSIYVDDGGYGGGSTYIPFVITLIQTAGTVGSAIGATLAAQRELVRLRYRNYRQLAKDWNDTGIVSNELRDAVYNAGSWERKEFNQAFGLGPARGPELLRALAFERRKDEWGEWWYHDFQQDDQPVD